jgi:hypothetical protein
MTTKLALYNSALRNLGIRRLSGLTEASEARRALDDAYIEFVDFVLAQGYWKFAQRVAKITYSPDVTVDFGYEKAYAKPSDFVRMHKFSSDEFLQVPLLEYTEEGDYWYGNDDDVYLSYVSNDASYGGGLDRWSPNFVEYAGLVLALRAMPRLKPEDNTQDMERRAAQALSQAQAKDAMEGPTEFLPASGWVNSRGRQNTRSRERGNRSSLIG